MSHSLKTQPLRLRPKRCEEMAKDSVIRHYWWVLLVVAMSFGMYAQAAHKKRQAINALESYLESLKKEKEGLLREKEELLLNINSQSDPAWIELTLMKGLGLVPEGKVKVYFDPVAEK
jgi:hypothetical protein